jgi:hypothetical protein
MVGKEVIGLALDCIRISLTSARGCRAFRTPFIRRLDWRRFQVTPFERLALCHSALDSELWAFTNLIQLVGAAAVKQIDECEEVPPASRASMGLTLICRGDVI